MQNKISGEKQFLFSKEIGNMFKFSLPLKFYKNTSFVESINLGMGGRWLKVGNLEIEKIFQIKKEPLIYYSHNIDNSTDQLNILKFFES